VILYFLYALVHQAQAVHRAQVVPAQVLHLRLAAAQALHQVVLHPAVQVVQVEE